jgi:hypothetical protein
MGYTWARLNSIIDRLVIAMNYIKTRTETGRSGILIIFAKKIPQNLPREGLN